MSIKVKPATSARFDDVATMLGPKNPESSVCWCLSHRVDWKTNRDQDADPLQLAIYRIAWAELVGVPVESVDAAFHYVRNGETVRQRGLVSKSEIAAILTFAK